MKINKIITLCMILLIMSMPFASSLTITDVKIKVIDENTAEVNWTTDVKSTSLIEYDVEASQILSLKKGNDINTLKHNIILNNLEENNAYKLHIKSNDGTNEALDNNNGLMHKFITPPKVEISNIKISPTRTNTLINFTTNIPISAKVVYGLTAQNLSKEVTSNEATEHSVQLLNLKSDTTYYYQIITEHKSSQFSTFKTMLTGNTFFQINVPDKYNNKYIEVIGKTIQLSHVLMQVQDGETRQTSQGTGETGEFRFSRVALKTNSMNTIKFTVTDQFNDKSEFTYNVFVDTIKPELIFETLPPTTVKEENSVRFVGTTSENVSITYETDQKESVTKIENILITEKSESGIVFGWDADINENFKHYKIIKNGVLQHTPVGNLYVDNFIASDTEYNYEIIMINKQCNKIGSATFTYTSEEGDIEEKPFTEYDYKCEPLISNNIVTDNIFDFEIPLEEGLNLINIKASDSAGNIFKKSFNITKDSIPPEITDISPAEATAGQYVIDQGSLGTRITIRGKTEPFATVKLYKNEPEGNPEKQVLADKNGNFEFKRVNIESLFRNKASHLPQQPEDILEDSRNEILEDRKDIEIFLVATDKLGNVGDAERLFFGIVPCGGGEMKFSIDPLKKIIFPPSLSPDRIEEGSEELMFTLNLTYNGNAKDWEVISLDLEDRCQIDSYKTDERFNLSCQLLPAGPTIASSNAEDNTAWFFTYKLKQMDDISKTTGLNTEDFLKAMTSEATFPFTAVLGYNENGKRKNMKRCFDISYIMDNSRIDPRKVLPDWLLDDTISLTNNTMKTIDKILPKIDKALKVVAAATIAGFIAKAVYRGVRKATCKVESTASETCPKDKNKLSDEELSTQCGNCYNAWQQEQKLDKAFRWAADRLLCRDAPAKWTSEDQNRRKVYTTIQENVKCSQKKEISTKGLPLTLIRKSPRGSEGVNYNSYFEFDNSHYVFDRQEGNEYVLKRVYTGGDIFGPPPTLNVIRDGKQVMIEESKIPLYYKNKMFEENGKKVILEEIKAVPQSTVCEKRQKEKPDLIVSENLDYSYREDLIGRTCYDENIYLKDRDFTKCFGQNNFLYKKKLAKLSKKEHTSAFQCMCLSGIHGRLKALKNIMAGLNSCFTQIKATGEADSATCKEIFNNYMCDTMWQVVSYFSEGCAPEDRILTETGGSDKLKMTFSSIFDSVGEIAAEVNNDYGNAVLDDYLSGGTRGIMRKVCLGSISGDWGLSMENVLDGAYSSSFNTDVGAFSPKRKYLGFLPFSDKSRYEYRSSWLIVPGCKIDGYNVDLACIDGKTQAERGLACNKAPNENHPYQGCDCLGLDEEKTMHFASGDTLTPGQLEDEGAAKTIESPYRYDHLKIKLFINDNKVRKECLPEGHEDGIFYFPIKDNSEGSIVDCNFNQQTGKFLCLTTNPFNKYGVAYFTTQDLPKKGTIFHPGDELVYRGTIFNEDKDKPKCLVAEVQDRNGHKLSGFPSVYRKISHQDNKDFTFKVADLKLGSSKVAFSETYNRYKNTGVFTILANENEKRERFTIKFVDFDDSQDFTFDGKDRYEIYGENYGTISNVKPIINETLTQEPIEFKKVKLSVDNVILPYQEQGGKNVLLDHTMYTFTADPINLKEESKEWTLHLELRRLPDGKSNCQDTTKEEGLRLSEFEWQKDIDFTVEPRKIIEDKKCKFDGTFKEQEECICGDGDEINCGNDEKGKYCVKNNQCSKTKFDPNAEQAKTEKQQKVIEEKKKEDEKKKAEEELASKKCPVNKVDQTNNYEISNQECICGSGKEINCGNNEKGKYCIENRCKKIKDKGLSNGITVFAKEKDDILYFDVTDTDHVFKWNLDQDELFIEKADYYYTNLIAYMGEGLKVKNKLENDVKNSKNCIDFGEKMVRSLLSIDKNKYDVTIQIENAEKKTVKFGGTSLYKYVRENLDCTQSIKEQTVSELP